ncbi:hypothetical protein [Thalassobacillus hwangdonensis]|uniref:Uncharacterized protein n=1 Tax=Thalassobacillus hwangdonensis TaxID=546108 RepID=A0ABW3L4D2_9BACI
MTQYTYLASPIKLPTVTLGLNPVSPDKPNEFATELDFTHLYFEGNYDKEDGKRHSYSAHFTFKNQVAFMNSHVPLRHEIDGSRAERKCLNILYSYLDEAITRGGMLEMFTCISGQEERALERKKSIRWQDIRDPYDLVMSDREFWSITL